MVIVIRRLVISDIHGCLNEFDALLKRVNYKPEEDQLILLGDYVDRGLRSKDVVERLIELKKENSNCVFLKGNHDQMMIDTIINNDHTWASFSVQTIRSYVGHDTFYNGYEWSEYVKYIEFIKKNYLHHIEFLNSLDYYYEDEKYIYVHAGINPSITDMSKQSSGELIWIRNLFIKNKHEFNKTIVFGHTPTKHLNHDGSYNVWFGDKKLGIDGGCSSGGQLNCLEVVEKDIIAIHSVKKGEV